MIISIDDVRDELVYPVLVKSTESKVDEQGEVYTYNKYMADLDDYYRDLVQSIAGIELEQLTSPPPYKLKELGKAKICQMVCLAKSYAASLATRGGEQKDSWSEKLNYYSSIVRQLEGQITKEMLIGDNQQTFLFGSVGLERA